MSITTLTGLKTAFVDRTGRADLSSTVQDECVALTEARLQRVLRALDMETIQTSLSLNGEFIPLPPDFLQVRDFYYTSGSVKYPLRYMSSEYQTRRYPSGSSQPAGYEVVGNSFRISPAPDAAYQATLIYYASIPPLTTVAPTNWILTKHPDCYLYGCCLEVAIKTKDVNSGTYYQGLFQDSIGAIQSSNNKARWGGPGLFSRPG